MIGNNLLIKHTCGRNIVWCKSLTCNWLKRKKEKTFYNINKTSGLHQN